MRKLFPAVHKSGILLAMLFAAFSASAADVTTWEPTTAAGGAPVPPAYWDQQASYQFFGGGQGQPNNVTLAPTQVDTKNSFTDYSTNTTNSSGGGAQANYTPITRDSSSMDVTNTTTNN